MVDDCVISAGQRRRGRPKMLSDSEVVCLAVAQQLLQVDSERRWVRYARKHFRGLFPYIPTHSGYHKRVKNAAGLLCRVQQVMARACPSWTDEMRLLDATPVPCGASRPTVKRSDLAGDANYGYCAAHSRYFWGFKLYLVTTLEGLPAAWCVADPKLGEAEVAAELLAHAREGHHLPDTVFLIGDRGFTGNAWDRDLRELDIAFARPDKTNEPYTHGKLGGIRQRIESIIWTLKGQLRLEQHHGRTLPGIFTRLASRILALTCAIWHNWNTGKTTKRSLIAYDH